MLKMEKIYNLLERHRLQSYYVQFQQLGVKDERDFLDSISDEDLTSLGLTHVEKNRFRDLQKFIGRLRAPVAQKSQTVQKSTKAFSLQYMYPMCSELKFISDMDPTQNTVEDLMLRIGFIENIGSSKGVCLYTVDGMPLTDDPFFNTWSLKDRHIQDGDLLYAIFTPKENLLTLQRSVMNPAPASGTDTVRCHVMLKGDFEVNVNLDLNTIADVKNRLGEISGIPANVLHYICDTGSGNTLTELGITEETILNFSLSSFTDNYINSTETFSDDTELSIQQTKKGISIFLSSLYTIKHKNNKFANLIGCIRKMTCCNPLAQSLHQLLEKNQIISRTQKIAVFEGLYTLFREILPKHGTADTGRIIKDQEVFEHSLFCWSYIMTEAKKENSHDNYKAISLISDNFKRFCEPVTVPGVDEPLERADVLQKIKDGGTIPLCTEEILLPTSLKRCTDIEKILLSVHPCLITYYLWIPDTSVSGLNFQLSVKKSLDVMAEEMKAFPLLRVTHPLELKNLGYADSCLVYLNEGTGFTHSSSYGDFQA